MTEVTNPGKWEGRVQTPDVNKRWYSSETNIPRPVWAKTTEGHINDIVVNALSKIFTNKDGSDKITMLNKVNKILHRNGKPSISDDNNDIAFAYYGKVNIINGKSKMISTNQRFTILSNITEKQLEEGNIYLLPYIYIYVTDSDGITKYTRYNINLRGTRKNLTDFLTDYGFVNRVIGSKLIAETIVDVYSFSIHPRDITDTQVDILRLDDDDITFVDSVIFENNKLYTTLRLMRKLLTKSRSNKHETMTHPTLPYVLALGRSNPVDTEPGKTAEETRRERADKIISTIIRAKSEGKYYNIESGKTINKLNKRTTFEFEYNSKFYTLVYNGDAAFNKRTKAVAFAKAVSFENKDVEDYIRQEIGLYSPSLDVSNIVTTVNPYFTHGQSGRQESGNTIEEEEYEPNVTVNENAFGEDITETGDLTVNDNPFGDEV